MKIKKIFFRLVIALIILYSSICFFFYVSQEKLIFQPEKLSENFVYQFPGSFEEINIKSSSGNLLNGLLFKTDSPKGVIVYFHGNAGSLRTWGNASDIFLENHYDVFISDYAGYGKSKGKLSGKNLFTDAQVVYDEIKKQYDESSIIVYGRSIGTGIAAKVASENNPAKLMLEAPFYSLADLGKRLYPWLPSFLLSYELNTNEFLKSVKSPVIIFHGDADEIIPIKSALELQKLLKPEDKFFIIKGGHHNDLKKFEIYQSALKLMLN